MFQLEIHMGKRISTPASFHTPISPKHMRANTHTHANILSRLQQEQERKNNRTRENTLASWSKQYQALVRIWKNKNSHRFWWECRHPQTLWKTDNNFTAKYIFNKNARTCTRTFIASLFVTAKI